MNTNTQPILEWQAPARPNYVRSQRWYTVSGIFCVVMIAYGILSDAWSLSVVFAFIPALYYLMRNQNHRMHTIRILEDGIDFDGQLTPWGQYERFWILQGDDYFELHVEKLKRGTAELVILTGPIDPYVLRDTLGQFIPQIGHQKERILDAFIRFCKL